MPSSRRATCWVVAWFGLGLVSGVELAQAQNPLLGAWGGPFSLRGYYGSGPYSLGLVPVPPYFALHPPVYYSAPVPRPYGYSPYALPPGFEPVEPAIVAKPLEVINPHVLPLPEKPREPTKATSGQVAYQPQLIVNPFYNGEVAPASYLTEVAAGN